MTDTSAAKDRKIGGQPIVPVDEQDRFINVLIYGDPGIGKTVLAGSASNVVDMSPVLMVDIEGGTMSLHDFYPDVDVVRVPKWQDLQKVYDELYRGDHGFKTVIIDSLTEAQKFCYSEDTEVLTNTGWKPLSKLGEHDLVAQYDKSSGDITFVLPSDYQEFEHDGKMIHFNNASSSCLVTPNHRMLVKMRGGNKYVYRADEVNNSCNLPLAGFMAGEDHSLTDNNVRVLVSYQADGTPHGNKYIWHLKKQRKIDRLKYLLGMLAIKYDENWNKDLTVNITVNKDYLPFIDKYLDEKNWTRSVLNLSIGHREALLNELNHWDGNSTLIGKATGRILYYTSVESNADIISAVAGITGKASSVASYEEDGYMRYRTQIVDREWRRASNIEEVEYTGKVYCVTVPSGFILTRREGKNTIAGNSMEQVLIDTEGEKGHDPDVPRMRDWGKNIEQMRRLVRAYRDLPMNVIFTALAYSERNKRGKTTFKPQMNGKVKSEIPAFLDIVLYMYIKEKDGKHNRYVVSQSTEEIIAKDRSNRLPMVVENPTMEKLYGLIVGDKTKEDMTD